MTSLLGDVERLTLEVRGSNTYNGKASNLLDQENQDEDLVNPDSSGGHERVETQQILPVENLQPYVLITTYQSDLGEVEFYDYNQQLIAVILDDQLCSIFRKYLPIRRVQVLPLPFVLYIVQQLDNKYRSLATLVDELVELELTRLRSRRLENSDADHRIWGNEFFLTILRRVKDGNTLIYRVVPMSVNDGELFSGNPTATVPGKIMRVEVCEDQPTQLSFTLWYLFRHDNLTWLAHQDCRNFGDLNDRVYFQVRQEGADNGHKLDIPPEIKISPWNVKWESN